MLKCYLEHSKAVLGLSEQIPVQVSVGIGRGFVLGHPHQWISKSKDAQVLYIQWSRTGVPTCPQSHICGFNQPQMHNSWIRRAHGTQIFPPKRFDRGPASVKLTATSLC